MPECLERALTDTLRQSRPIPATHSRSVSTSHRLPLGLLLLSRQQLTVEQLRTGLEAQRAAGHGRIGQWLQTLGFVSEQQVTAALARQWSCPMLRSGTTLSGSNHLPQIPLLLLNSFGMMPVSFVEATATLYVAFGEGIDYGLLNSIERMLECRTEACLVNPSVLRKSLVALAERGGQTEVVFESVADAYEFARIIRSYADRVSASEIRMVSCQPYIWVRLYRPPQDAMNLLVHAPADASGVLPVPHAALSSL
jgi:hypothetical protein